MMDLVDIILLLRGQSSKFYKVASASLLYTKMPKGILLYVMSAKEWESLHPRMECPATSSDSRAIREMGHGSHWAN